MKMMFHIRYIGRKEVNDDVLALLTSITVYNCMLREKLSNTFGKNLLTSHKYIVHKLSSDSNT